MCRRFFGVWLDFYTLGKEINDDQFFACYGSFTVFYGHYYRRCLVLLLCRISGRQKAYKKYLPNGAFTLC